MVDKRLLRSRKAIEEAFLRLLMKKKYEDITVADIVKEADYSKTAFYNNFADKAELLDSMSKKIAEEIMDDLIKCALEAKEMPMELTDDRRAMSLQHITAPYDTVYLHKDYFLAMHHAFGPMGVNYVFRHLLEMQKGEELFKQYSRKDIDIDLFNYAHLWDIIGAVSWWIANDFKYSAKYMGLQQFLRLTNI